MKGGLLRRAMIFLGLASMFGPAGNLAKNDALIPEPGIKPQGHFKKPKKRIVPGAGKRKVEIAICKKIYRNWHTGKDGFGRRKKKLLKNAA